MTKKRLSDASRDCPERRWAKCAAAFFLALAVSGFLAPLSGRGADAQTSPPPESGSINFVWAEQFGTDASDNARSVTVDPSDGSPVVAGSTNGALDPTGSPSLAQPNLNAGGEDAFIRKHDQGGAKKWTRQFGSSLGDSAQDVAVAPDGSVYVAGYGDPAGRGRAGAFIAKYLPDGTPATLTNTDGSTGGPWIRQFSSGRIWTFALDPQGNPYIAVSINSDVYMYKYNTQGQFEAGEPFGAYGCYGSGLLDIAFGSAVGQQSGDSSVYITGITSGAGIDDPNNCNISGSKDELFLAKFDGALNKKWHKQFGANSGSSVAIDVAVDSADPTYGDYAYVAGYTGGAIVNPATGTTTNSNAGGRDAFLTKFDGDDGSFKWADQFGTDQNDFAWGIGIDPGDDSYGNEATVFLAGQTAGALEKGKPNAGANDAFVAKYTALGERTLVRQFGTTADDNARGVAFDELSNSVLVAGNTNGALDGKTNAGGYDAFLVKLRAQNLDAGPPPGSAGEKTPVILVPGIGGTRLNHASSADDSEKWPSGFRYSLPLADAPLRDLKLAPNGEDPYTSEDKYRTSVGDIIRTEAGQDVYANTIKRFEEAGYVEGETLFPFPLDWRKDARTTEGGADLYSDLYGRPDWTLPEFIDYVKDRGGKFPMDNPDHKVDIIAHSQGGLVTLAALRDPATNLPDGTSKVRKVLTLGTPVLGSPKALALLQYQAGCFPGVFPLNGECIANPATLQETVTNFPGIYQLLPSRRMQDAEGSPLAVEMDEDGNGQPDGEKPYDYWTGVTDPDHDDSVSRDRNATLMGAADVFHQGADDPSAAPLADPSIVAQGNFVRIVGDSLATPDYMRKYEDNDPADCLADINVVCGPGENVEYEFEMTRNDRLEGGDGTVPLHSADLFNPGKSIDLRGGVPNFYAHGVEHGTLASDDSVLGFALSFLGDDPPRTQPSVQQASVPLNDFFSMRTAQAEPLDDLVKLAEENGLGTTPESFSGVELVTEGPVSGFVEDGESRTLGEAPGAPTDTIVQDIPGGDYNFISDSRSFFLNEEGSYTARLRALEGAENVKLKVRTYAEGQLAGQAFFRVDPAAGDTLALSFASSQTLAELKLSMDGAGDGTFDQETGPTSVATGPAASETDAPTTTAATKLILPELPRRSGDEDEKDDEDRRRPRPTKALVTLSAEDGLAGSSVAATYYQLEGDAQPRVYESPFEASLGTIVRFASSDKAGNSEAPKELLVDDGSNTRQSAEPVSLGVELRRYVDHKGDEDWFVFEADGRSVYRAKLYGLPADYDVEVYDESGRKVAAPARRGKRSEEVLDRLTAGRYYLRVVGREDAWSAGRPYKLKVDGPRENQADD